jgi:four helix bundle protein
VTNAEENANMFKSYEVSIDLIAALRPIIPIVARRDRNLADQLKRAASSVALNLAEGARYRDGNRGKHYNIAHGSANEVKAALDVAEVWGYVDAAAARVVLDRLLALLWGLCEWVKRQHIASTRSSKARASESSTSQPHA